MAIFFCRLSHGKVGKAVPHFEYIHGMGKYNYKKDEVAYVTENMPKNITGHTFFSMSDELERANGMTYKEIKLALPKELSLENNIDLLNDFIKKELGNKYYYSAVIHDKETDNNKTQNIHVHLMFSTRELDNIQRDIKLFFKKSNPKNKELGGCSKNPKWDSKNAKTLKEIRLSWEETLNQHLQKHNIEKVSCLSLKEQYQNALLENDIDKAKMLNRKSVHIDMRILKKALSGQDLTKSEKKQYKKFLGAKEIKYRLEKEYQEILLSKEKIATQKIELNKINSNSQLYKSTPEFINKKYTSFIDIEKQILNVEKELEKNKIASSSCAVKVFAIGTLNKNYETLYNEQQFFIEKLNTINSSSETDEILIKNYTEKIENLQNKLDSISESLNPNDINNFIEKLNTINSSSETDEILIKNYTEKIENLQNKLDSISESLNPNDINNIINKRIYELDQKKISLIKDKEQLINDRKVLYENPDINKYSADQIIFNTKFSFVIDQITQLEWELNKINKDLVQLDKKLSPIDINKYSADQIIFNTKFSFVIDQITQLEWELNKINKDLVQLDKKLSPITLKETAKNVLSKGRYRKINKDIKRTIDKMNTITRNINAGMYDIREDLLLEKQNEYNKLQEKLKVLEHDKNNLFNNINLYKLGKLENSMKEKMEAQKEKLFERRYIVEQEINFYKLYLSTENSTQELFENKYRNYSKEQKYYNSKVESLNKIKEILNENFSTLNIKKIAYNKITKGAYNKLIKEFENNKSLLNSLLTEKESLSKLNPKILLINKEISKLNKKQQEVKERYHNMLNAIDQKTLNKVIDSLEEHKLNVLKNIDLKIKDNSLKIYENTFKKSKVYNLKEEVYPPSFEHFKNKAINLHHKQQEDIGYSRCLFDEEEEKQKQLENSKSQEYELDL